MIDGVLLLAVPMSLTVMPSGSSCLAAAMIVGSPCSAM
jgi:hypothetical protein